MHGHPGILENAATSFALGAAQYNVGEAGISLGLEEGGPGKMALSRGL